MGSLVSPLVAYNQDFHSVSHALDWVEALPCPWSLTLTTPPPPYLTLTTLTLGCLNPSCPSQMVVPHYPPLVLAFPLILPLLLTITVAQPPPWIWPPPHRLGLGLRWGCLGWGWRVLSMQAQVHAGNQGVRLLRERLLVLQEERLVRELILVLQENSGTQRNPEIL